ncbi:MAG: UDP-N-acetylglucosamine--N-acetylmuramyl-(pentapeptide) pyrophosphoryl-undecaprenol N-acetylglucosamine transferase [Candidatus Omnitrophota bacterium]
MRVLAVTGASGGHIFPALSFIDALKEKRADIDTLLVLPERGLRPGVMLADGKIKYISTATLTSGLNTANLVALVRFLKGVWESLRIILGFKPDMVVGFGSSDSIPCLLIAWLFRIRTLIHEQNVIPGKANRLLARFADRVAVSFKETAGYLKIDPEKIVFTGNPLRRQIKIMDKNACLDIFGLSQNRFTLLVMGGSQGSRRVNAGILKALGSLKDVSQLQVIHLAGRGNLDEVKEAYGKMGIIAAVFEFFAPIEKAYSASDLVITRAGGSAIAELIYFRLPAVILPYPFAYAHQLANARVLQEAGCAVIVDDAALDQGLGPALGSLLDNREKLGKMRAGFAGLSTGEAAGLLADAALSLN